MKLHTPRSLRAEVLLAAVLAAGCFSPAVAQTYKVLHNFGGGTDGSIPSGAPFVDAKGRLAGNTYDGGTGICSDYGCGMTYALLPQPNGEWKEISLHEFTGTSDGAEPFGNLVVDSDGNLYSTEHGDAGPGAVFELSRAPLEWNLTPIYGPYFSPGLLLDADGNLYGFFGQGDLGSGAIGKLSPGPSGWMYTELYSICSQQGGCPDGASPESPLSWDSKGNLYGTTLYGGVSVLPCPGSLGCGVAFQMTPNGDGTWTYHVMDRFASYKGDGLYPYAGLTLDAFGNAYGATASGGTYGNGTIFKLSPSAGGWKKTVLYEFPNCAEGCVPSYTLVFDKAGNLYGSGGGGNPECGSYTCGTIFRLIPQAGGKWKYQAVYKFSGTDGAFPYGVVIDGRGHMFGTTSGGGTYNSGVLFEISQ